MYKTRVTEHVLRVFSRGLEMIRKGMLFKLEDQSLVRVSCEPERIRVDKKLQLRVVTHEVHSGKIRVVMDSELFPNNG